MKCFERFLYTEKAGGLVKYALFFAAVFYVVPLVMKNTFSAILVLLCLFPVASFFCALYYGIKSGFSLWIPAITSLLFAGSIFIYYNSTAYIYIAIYGLIALLGNAAGAFLKKHEE